MQPSYGNILCCCRVSGILGLVRGVTLEEPAAVILHGGICEGCALKAYGIQLFEITTAAKLSSQPRTESCVMSGDGHCEA